MITLSRPIGHTKIFFSFCEVFVFVSLTLYGLIIPEGVSNTWEGLEILSSFFKKFFSEMLSRWWGDVQRCSSAKKGDNFLFKGLAFWNRMCYNPSRMEAWGQTLMLGILSDFSCNKKPLIFNEFWLVRASLVGPKGTTMLHTHEVTGSSPVVSTKKSKHTVWCAFLFWRNQGRTDLNH